MAVERGFPGKLEQRINLARPDIAAFGAARL